MKSLTLNENLFNADKTIKDIRILSEIDNGITYDEAEIESDIDDGDIPF